MRAFSQSIAVAAVLVLSFSGGVVQAACNKSNDEIVKSTELKRLLDQLDLVEVGSSHTVGLALGLGVSTKEYEALNFAAQAGFVLSQQVRYLGDSTARRAMFDCMHDFVQKLIAADAMKQGYSFAEPSAAFTSAVLGMLDDTELAALGVDPAMTVTSMFSGGEEQWIGKWELASTTPAIHTSEGKLYPVKNQIQVWREKDEVWVGSLPEGVAPSVHPQFTETDMTVTMKSAVGTPFDFTLTQKGGGCTGVLHSVTLKGEKLTWKTTCHRM